MRIVWQRVSSASVTVGEDCVGGIGVGALLLVGLHAEDGTAQVSAAVEKLSHLRAFEDPGGKMNLDAAQAGAAFLVVSQFTLAGSTRKGRRPSFDTAMPPEQAEPMLEELVAGLRKRGFAVETGRFGAHMHVELVNDGPVTFVLEL